MNKFMEIIHIFPLFHYSSRYISSILTHNVLALLPLSTGREIIRRDRGDLSQTLGNENIGEGHQPGNDVIFHHLTLVVLKE
jgi:hypothetical protein